MRYTETVEICDVCGKRFHGAPINVHGSLDYIKHTNFSNNIHVMFARARKLPKEERTGAIVAEFFKRGNDEISKKDAIEYLECFKHYKECTDKELLEDVFAKIQAKIDTMED